MQRDEDGGEMEERRSIRDSGRKLKKYGSTSNKHATRNEQLMKHVVSKEDTLQGIALKYGVTVRIKTTYSHENIFK